MDFLSNAPNNPKPKNVSDVQRQPEIFPTSSPPASIEGLRFVSEPMTKERREAYNSHLLIPIRYSKDIYAMSGPLSAYIENPTKNRAFFLTHPRLKPIGCAKKPRNDPEDATPANQQHAQTKEDINLQFMNKGNRIFRSCPSLSSEYSDWLNKMEKVQTPIWKEMGIYDMVMLSKTGLSYCPLMLVSSLYFWDNTPISRFIFPVEW